MMRLSTANRCLELVYSGVRVGVYLPCMDVCAHPETRPKNGLTVQPPRTYELRVITKGAVQDSAAT